MKTHRHYYFTLFENKKPLISLNIECFLCTSQRVWITRDFSMMELLDPYSSLNIWSQRLLPKRSEPTWIPCCLFSVSVSSRIDIINLHFVSEAEPLVLQVPFYGEWCHRKLHLSHKHITSEGENNDGWAALQLQRNINNFPAKWLIKVMSAEWEEARGSSLSDWQSTF